MAGDNIRSLEAKRREERVLHPSFCTPFFFTLLLFLFLYGPAYILDVFFFKDDDALLWLVDKNVSLLPDF